MYYASVESLNTMGVPLPAIYEVGVTAYSVVSGFTLECYHQFPLVVYRTQLYSVSLFLSSLFICISSLLFLFLRLPAMSEQTGNEIILVM